MIGVLLKKTDSLQALAAYEKQLGTLAVYRDKAQALIDSLDTTEMASLVFGSNTIGALKSDLISSFGNALQNAPAEVHSQINSDYTPPGGDFMYELNKAGDGIVITRYTGDKNELIYPAEIEGYPVKEIFVSGASVVIPENVEIVRGRVSGFISLPSTLIEFNLWEFSGSAIDFSRCVNLERIGNAGSGNPVFKKLTSIDLSACGKLTSIGSSVFEGCKSLQTVILPDSVEKIGGKAFYGCENLTSINIPANIKSIGNGENSNYTFYRCTNLYNLTIPENITGITFYHTYSPSDGNFSGCGKLPLATRKRLQDLGYKGGF
jgi:hypothetical protein